MFAIALLFVCVLCDFFKSRCQLEAKILVLRSHLNVLRLIALIRLALSWPSTHP